MPTLSRAWSPISLQRRLTDSVRFLVFDLIRLNACIRAVFAPRGRNGCSRSIPPVPVHRDRVRAENASEVVTSYSSSRVKRTKMNQDLFMIAVRFNNELRH